MNKFFKLMLVVVLLIPMFTTNNVQVEARRYSTSHRTSSLARSRNSKSLNSLNKKNNYSSNKNNQSSSMRSRSYMRTGGGILGALLIGNLLFGSSPVLSMLTTILFWFFIFKFIGMLFGRKKTSTHTTTNQNNYNNTGQANSHHMQQMAIINDLVNEASNRDIDVSYILDDEYTSLDEKITLIRQQLNKM